MLRKKIAVIIFFVLLVTVGLLVYLGQRGKNLDKLVYSGTIEATDANLAFQTSGRVLHVLVQEGQTVARGQVLAELDRAESKARFEQARAGRDKVLQQLKQLETLLKIYQKTLPDDVARAEAAVQALKSQLDELLAGNRVQDVERARLALLAAKSVLEEAKRERQRSERLFPEGLVSEKERDVARRNAEVSLRDYERAQAAYDLLKEGARAEVIAAARARLAEGEAALRNARHNLQRLEVTKRDVEAARAQLREATASLDQAEIQLGYTRLLSPITGTIISRNIEPGEVVTPTREVLTLSDLSRVDLKIYVGETEIGKVRAGQPAEVKVDSYPDKIYRGTVAFISPEGEFTPKFIQTHKERVKLVYLVKVSLPNPDHELKTGMPADAWL